MGISLSYITIDTVAADVQATVKADAERINDEHQWWCESLNFLDWPGHEGKLAGDTKLFLPGYSTVDGGYVEVDPVDDCFMAARDARFIFEQLARWSVEHGLNWCLQIQGEEMGGITNGEVDDELLGMISTLSLLDAEDPDLEMLEMNVEVEVDDEQCATMIDKKYASRLG